MALPGSSGEKTELKKGQLLWSLNLLGLSQGSCWKLTTKDKLREKSKGLGGGETLKRLEPGNEEHGEMPGTTACCCWRFLDELVQRDPTCTQVGKMLE